MWKITSFKMAYECEQCDRRFISQESLGQHVSVKHPNNAKKKNKRGMKSYVIFGLIGLIILFLSITVYSYSKKPGEFDDFAKCLSESGAVIYGNDFCSYTGQQLNFFGKSDKYLNYVKCSNNQELCDKKGVTVTPTWEIKGEMYKQVQTFEKLSALTGCEI